MEQSSKNKNKIKKVFPIVDKLEGWIYILQEFYTAQSFVIYIRQKMQVLKARLQRGEKF